MLISIFQFIHSLFTRSRNEKGCRHCAKSLTLIAIKPYFVLGSAKGKLNNILVIVVYKLDISYEQGSLGEASK
jgi:hypothetical protein